MILLWYSSVSSIKGRISLDTELDGGATWLHGERSGGGTKVTVKEPKWFHDRESYLVDDGDMLPLPMSLWLIQILSELWLEPTKVRNAPAISTSRLVNTRDKFFKFLDITIIAGVKMKAQ